MAVLHKNIPPRKVPVNLGTLGLDPTRGDAMIEKYGVQITQYTTLWCPNVKRIDSLEHELNCPLCHGQLLIDINPVDTWAFLQTQSLQKQFRTEGAWDDQMVAATFMSGIEINYFSKIVLKDYTSTFFEHIQRSEGNLDVCKYPITSVNYLIDKNGITYVENGDFIVNQSGYIEWLMTAKTPPKGTIYSIHYNYKITFRSINAMHIMRIGAGFVKGKGRQALEYQQQWQLKRDFLITRADLQSNPIFASAHVSGFPEAI